MKECCVYFRAPVRKRNGVLFVLGLSLSITFNIFFIFAITGPYPIKTLLQPQARLFQYLFKGVTCNELRHGIRKFHDSFLPF